MKLALHHLKWQKHTPACPTAHLWDEALIYENPLPNGLIHLGLTHERPEKTLVACNTSLNPSLLGGTCGLSCFCAAANYNGHKVPPKKEGFREVWAIGGAYCYFLRKS